jgi:hypothetical protein
VILGKMGREDMLAKLPVKLPEPLNHYLSEAIRTAEDIPVQYLVAGVFGLLTLAYISVRLRPILLSVNC